MRPNIYVSAPMRGVKNENAHLFEHARKKLVACGCNPIIPSDLSHMHNCKTDSEFMQVDLITIIQEAHAVVVVGNILDILASNGCQAEMFTAAAVNKPVFTCYHKRKFNPTKWCRGNSKQKFFVWLATTAFGS